MAIGAAIRDDVARDRSLGQLAGLAPGVPAPLMMPPSRGNAQQHVEMRADVAGHCRVQVRMSASRPS